LITFDWAKVSAARTTSAAAMKKTVFLTGDLRRRDIEHLLGGIEKANYNERIGAVSMRTRSGDRRSARDQRAQELKRPIP
jgi:hypothetical protein